MMNAGPLTFDAVRDAAVRLKGVTVRTPLLHSPEIDARAGGPVLIKAEALQRMGSFKLRGAYNRLAQIPDGERARGAVAFSSGNHARCDRHAGGCATGQDCGHDSARRRGRRLRPRA
jgi:threonine dehydratase